MPEFILYHGSKEAYATFKSLDAFAQGYIEAMFFTCANAGDELEHAPVAQLAPETIALIVKDCDAFQRDNAELLARAYRTEYKSPLATYDATMAGRDFWYTRNGHGTGFWDRGLAVGADLALLAEHHGAVDLYRGDDGALYLT